MNIRPCRICFGTALLLIATFPVSSFADQSEISAVGFGSNATGGAGGRTCEVSSLADEGDNTLRSCINDGGPVEVNFSIDGTIETSKYLYLVSDMTIDGSGAEITISGADGMACFGKSNIIIKNVEIADVGSGIRFREKCSDIWIDRVHITRAKDEGIAIDQGSTNVTISNSRIDHTEKAILIGSSATDTDTKNSRVTIHNNILSAKQRNPNVRHASVHVFNNAIIDYLFEGVIASEGAKVIVENNIIRPADSSNRKFYGLKADVHNQGDENEGYIWADGNLFADGASYRGSGLSQGTVKPESVISSIKNFVFYPGFFSSPPEPFEIPYDYHLLPADLDLLDTLEKTVGPNS